MPMLPGGPDKPPGKKVVVRRRVVVAPKKPKRKTTKRNVYTSAPPRPRTPATTPPKPIVPGPEQRVAPVAGPYDRFKDIPGALTGFAQIAADQNLHQTYVNEKVAPWLTSGLQGLAQFNTDAQNQYMGNVQGGAVGAAIAPNQVSGGPGGIVAGNNSYLTGAGQEFARASGSTAQQIAAYQGAMNKMQPTTLSQGYINSLADYAKGLPAIYSERRRAFTEKLEGYLAEVQQAQAEAAYEQAQWQAEFDEKARHNRVTESISATNASTNAAFQASRLGLDANDQAFDQQQDLTTAATPAPAGYVNVNGKFIKDRTFVEPARPGSGGGGAARNGTSTRDAQGRPRVPLLQEKGYVGGWAARPKKVPAGAKVVQAANGRWYMLKKGAGATTATQQKKAKGATGDDVYNKVTSALDKDAIASDQNTGTGDLLRILKTLQPTSKANFAAWWAETAPILRRIDPAYEEWMSGYIKRRKQGVGGVSWKGLF